MALEPITVPHDITEFPDYGTITCGWSISKDTYVPYLKFSGEKNLNGYLSYRASTESVIVVDCSLLTDARSYDLP